MRERTARRAAALLLLCLAAFFGHAAAAVDSNPRPLRIGVATMQPGEIFFERFGHDSIVIDDPAKGEPLSYNFGFFDPAEPGFLGRFVDNQMQYQLVALPFAEDMVHYRETGRGVSIQWLDLTDAEAERLEAKLVTNALPEHARYRYQYFTDNCATRVRDAIDEVLGGTLRPQFEARSTGNSFRSEAVRLASPAPWMWLGFDIGLGPSADIPNSLWQDAFVPMRLAEGLREVRRSDGRPLVKSEQRVLPHRIAPEPSVVARPWWPWLLAGLAKAVAILLLAWWARRAAGAIGLVFWTTSSIVGLLMAFIWFGTGHTFGWANQNLLLFNPLGLLLLPGAWRIARGRPAGRLFRAGLWTIAACTIAALFAHWLPLQPQRNAHWIALLAPIQIAWLIAFTRPSVLPR
ncbi:MAG: DUF4105 domain-containing protein [Luteimonas sp.]